MRPVAFYFHRMTGRIDGLERLRRGDFHIHADFFDRFGGEFFRVERINVAHQAGVGIQNLGVGQRDVLAAVRFDGENAHLEDIAAGIFEQRRVTHFAHDVLVNLPRLVRRQQLGFDLPSPDVHREFVNLRALGDGEKIRALETLRVRVVKLLIHRRRGDLAVNLHIHVVVRHLQGSKNVRPRRGWPRLGRSRAGPPMRFLHDDEPVRATLRRGRNQTEPGQQNRTGENSFHGWLDGSTGKMLPTKSWAAP